MYRKPTDRRRLLICHLVRRYTKARFCRRPRRYEFTAFRRELATGRASYTPVIHQPTAREFCRFCKLVRYGLGCKICKNHQKPSNRPHTTRYLFFVVFAGDLPDFAL